MLWVERLFFLYIGFLAANDVNILAYFVLFCYFCFLLLSAYFLFCIAWIGFTTYHGIYKVLISLARLLKP